MNTIFFAKIAKMRKWQNWPKNVSIMVTKFLKNLRNSIFYLEILKNDIFVFLGGKFWLKKRENENCLTFFDTFYQFLVHFW